MSNLPVPVKSPEMSLDHLERVAAHLDRSGFYGKGNVSAAVVKMLCAQAMGLHPVVGASAIHVVNGNPTLSAGLIGALVRRSGIYDWEVLESTDETCRIHFWRKDTGGELIYSFTRKDAERAGVWGKDMWKKFPRPMLFNRCLAAGARAFCPDVLFGLVIYTPEELGDVTPEYTIDVSAPIPPTTTVQPDDPPIIEAELVPETPNATAGGRGALAAPAAFLNVVSTRFKVLTDACLRAGINGADAMAKYQVAVLGKPAPKRPKDHDETHEEAGARLAAYNAVIADLEDRAQAAEDLEGSFKSIGYSSDRAALFVQRHCPEATGSFLSVAQCKLVQAALHLEEQGLFAGLADAERDPFIGE